MERSKLASRLLQSASRDDKAVAAWRKLEIRAAKLVRRAVLRLGFDPACLIHVRGVEVPLRVPLSHRMPLYRARYPRYDALPTELAGFIRTSRGALRMIDVGANVGDTILSTAPCVGDRYLAIEPHPDFFPYLVANMQGLGDVTNLQMACGESNGILGFDPAFGGTAAPLVGRVAEHQIPVSPLDQIWKEHWQAATVNFLKIDTDGFDTAVLMGASELLRAQQPWVFYECDVGLTQNGLQRHLETLIFLRDVGYRHVIAFDNVGNFIECMDDGDTPRWEKLFATQCVDGPIHYHDLLVVPPGEDFERLGQLLNQKLAPAASAL